MNLYSDFATAKRDKTRLLAILIDPDKVNHDMSDLLVSDICDSPATHIFVGGSLVHSSRVDELIRKLRDCKLPIILFPGNPSQISPHADGILFLSLISGSNPDYLIGHQIAAAPLLKRSNLEIISTGYILIESGGNTAVAQVSKTIPMSTDNIDKIVATAQAGEMLGHKLIYLEAGSGANHAVNVEIISQVSQNVEIPLIVGGGIRTQQGINSAYDAGADVVVIGTAFENNRHFFRTL